MLAQYIREANADYRRVRQRIPLGPLRTEEEYHRAVAVLDEIVDEIGERETHPLADLAETLGIFIEAYENANIPFSDPSAPVLLRTLMEEHGLTQSDLSEIGSQGVVSEILSGKRDLNLRQITLLSVRFGVSPAIFMPAPIKSNTRRSRRTRKAPAR
ncbi:MAG: helix-turn-helix domain-containing protein [Nitrospira sp.]|nr:helix-turn-helix domain-containing protein [Nitrospira sp.]MDH4304303.1 helix-turn-helix domain-containing protein [Nitrospira sp.]MDH5195243.1 helix-turn-helix domain-containing protein [Nitrospira sp.]